MAPDEYSENWNRHRLGGSTCRGRNADRYQGALVTWGASAATRLIRLLIRRIDACNHDFALLA